MIYPTIKLDNSTSVLTLIDTEFPELSILSVKETTENLLPIFSILLKAFYNQYNCGYDDGWDDAEDFLEG